VITQDRANSSLLRNCSQWAETSEIPHSVPFEVRNLICDCWSNDPLSRPSFSDILDRLKDMQFKVTRKVNSMKVNAFVEAIERYEFTTSAATPEPRSDDLLN
jgi:hypothetical protein